MLVSEGIQIADVQLQQTDAVVKSMRKALIVQINMHNCCLFQTTSIYTITSITLRLKTLTLSCMILQSIIHLSHFQASNH